MPYNRKAEENAPSRKYFMAASCALERRVAPAMMYSDSDRISRAMNTTSRSEAAASRTMPVRANSSSGNTSGGASGSREPSSAAMSTASAPTASSTRRAYRVMPSSATAPSKAVFAMSQFHQVSHAAAAMPARQMAASRSRRARGHQATTSSATRPVTARASSGATARHSICGRLSGVSAAWARTCTGASKWPGARPRLWSGSRLGGHEGGGTLAGGAGQLDDALDRRLHPLEDGPWEQAEDDDGGEQRGQHRPLAPVEVGDGAILRVC